MKNEIVKIHSEVFEEKKKALQKFTNKDTNEFALPKMEQKDKFFFWADKKVTGDDLNSVTSKIQDQVLQQNDFMKEIVGEIKVVYETFEALDKDYIQGIMAALLKGERADNNAEKALKDLEGKQREIELMVSQLNTVMMALQQYKAQLQKIDHLLDVDKLYKDFEDLQYIYTSFSQKMENERQERQAIIDNITTRIEANVASTTYITQSLSKYVVASESRDRELQDTIVNTMHEGQVTLEKNLQKLEGDFDNALSNQKTEFLTINEELNNELSEQTKVLKDVIDKNKQETDEKFTQKGIAIENSFDDLNHELNEKNNELKVTVDNLSKQVKMLKVTISISIPVLLVIIIFSSFMVMK